MTLLSNITIFFHHYPHALHDLMHHEDKTLLQKGAKGISATRPSNSIDIEKNIDPGIARSEQNLGLLIQDYLKTLPEYTSETHQSEALIEHWRKLLTEQPRRLAEAHLESWNNEKSRHFWHERLQHYHTDFGIKADHFPNAIDDWERSAGTFSPPAHAQGPIKTKQWEDLLIRQRIHLLDLHNMGRDRK